MDISLLGSTTGPLITTDPQARGKANRAKDAEGFDVQANINAQILGAHQEANPAVKEGGSLDVDASVNSQIINDTETVSLSVKGNEQQLVYKNAIDELNAILKPIYGDKAIENADPESYAPKATADRIVQFATAFFESYKTQNPSLSEEEALNKYMDIVSGAIDKGFNEARNILEGLSVFNGSVQDNADKTYEFIQTGLIDFRKSFAPPPIVSGDTSGANAVI